MEYSESPAMGRHSREGVCEKVATHRIETASPKMKPSSNSDINSSFPRKRESRGGVRKIRRRLYCGNAAWIPAFEHVKKLRRPTNSSSFPRKRESRDGARKTRRRLYCGTAGPDSRFRGNDEVLTGRHCLSLRQFFDASTIVVGPADFFTRSFAGMTKSGRVSRFLQSLFRRNDGAWRERPVSLRTRRTRLKTRCGPE